MTTNEERAAMLEGFADDLDGPNWRGMAEALRAGAGALRAAADHQAEAPSDATRDALIEGVKLSARNLMRNDPRVWYEALASALDQVLPEFWSSALAARPVMDEATAKDIVARMRGHQQVMEDPDGWLWTCTCGKWHGGDFDVHCLMAALAPDGQEKNR